MDDSMDGPVVRSTITQFKNFLESTVWADIKSQIVFMANRVTMEFIDCKENDEILRMQGRLEVLRDMQVFIPEILEGLKDDKAREEREAQRVENEQLNEKEI